MFKQKRTLTLSQLAEAFTTAAEEYKNRQKRQEQLAILNHRIAQLTNLNDEAKILVAHSKRMRSKEIAYSVPKQKIAGRIRNLKNLIDKYNESPKIIAQPQIIDTDAYKNTYQEVEDKLKTAWKKFASYDKRADSYIKIADDDQSVDDTVKKIKESLEELTDLKNSLPDKKEDIDYVKKIKDEILQACDNVEAEGLDDEICSFLADARNLNGFPLTKLLKSKKIISWVQKKNRAESFMIQRKNT